MNRMQQDFSNREQQPTRLNKYLSENGVCSRREADRLIEAGRVTVDGKPAVSGQKVLQHQQILVDGRGVTKETEMILLAVNKPRGIVCSSKSQGGDTTIEEFLHYPKRIYSIGRLDKDSEGLLLMTNNGEILNKIMRAGNFHEKEYLVEVNREFDEHFLRDMAEGVWLSELSVRTRPCRMERVDKRRFRIILTQGLNRQIRRMCSELGYRVVALRRERIMNIRLGHLKTGAWRKVTNTEMEELYDLIRDSRG
ncbi:MAG: pseudouridine synthase [Eubacteriales bacterium]|nr:pseudouridine synthase [Eubacteriales bacterium]